MTDYHFRNIIKDDLYFVLQGFRETHGGLCHANEDDFRQRILEDFLISSPKASLLLLEKASEKIGYVMFSKCYFASTGLVLWVSQAYVAKEFRGRGSRALLYAMKAKAHELDAKRIIWATDKAKNDLSPLWRRIGAKEWTQDYTFWGLKPR
jgi:GNAT superfamily N-acetyltransferase